MKTGNQCLWHHQEQFLDKENEVESECIEHRGGDREPPVPSQRRLQDGGRRRAAGSDQPRETQHQRTDDDQERGRGLDQSFGLGDQESFI
jgi:hypothetical protein